MNNRRYYQIAGITIQVDADLPITDTTFDPKFRLFEVAEPGDDIIRIHHHFKLPELREDELGEEVYRRPPWVIYRNQGTWTYLGILPWPQEEVWRVAVFDQGHGRGDVYSPGEQEFRRGNWHALTLLPTDQILLARALADRQACYLHSAGVVLNRQGLLFVGHSEAGKSTTVKMLQDRAEILCDDRNVVRRWPEGFRIHGTWSHGEVPDVSPASAPLRAILSASLLIKAFSSEKRTVGAVMEQLQAARQIAMEQTVVNSLANLIIGSMPSAARAIVLAGGAILIVRGEWTLGSLLAFQSYLAFVYEPARFLSTANLQLQNALASLERVSTLFDIVPEENSPTGRTVDRLAGEVEFQDVTFSYNGSDPVVEHVSFHVRPGEHVAIVGPSGVGKTTLLSFLLRFYIPTRGEICFDGAPASAYQLESLRRLIGYVPQSTLLLSGTIIDNLRYGNQDADTAVVMQAARAAGIHDYIASLPDGYQAKVGEKGVNLSEGQKQRMAIARALIKNPDILILDEPSSALDSLVEKSIFDALPSLVRDKTLFIVAHRLSTIQKANRILLLNEKRLVATGTHEELLESNAYYGSLVASQQPSHWPVFAEAAAPS